MFTQGQRVIARFDDGREEPGTVAYQRMDPCSEPPFSKPEAVSVVLDSRIDRPGYVGTMFFAAAVRPESTQPETR